MKLSNLKKIRVVISLLLLVPASLVFLDFTNTIPPGLITGFLTLQFLPSLSHTLHLLGLATLGLGIVFLITVLFGRVYCSTLCPLGTLQDIISFLARKAHRHRWHRELPAYNGLRYSLLILTVLSLATGAMGVVSLLDPFSNFGRILAGLARPAVLGINNGAALMLETFGVFALYPLQIRGIGWLSLIVPGLLLVLVGWLAWTRGRLYCNTVCPVGTLLGLLSLRSVYRISIHADECTGCGLCQRVCKAGCIDSERKTVDMSRCVGCYNCFPECPTAGITYDRVPRAPAQPVGVDRQKRDLLVSSLFYLGALAGVPPGQARKIIVAKDTTVLVTRNIPVTPPGAAGMAQYTERCTACHLCISTCPTQVLVPSFLDYGIFGILQPQMDYRVSFCNFECTRCTEVCPTGALLPLSLDVKKTTQLGAAKFIKDNCVVYTEGTECAACSEHCPTKAVRMVPYKHLMAPEVKEEYCIGCGACEFACPTKPFKAIYVDGLKDHTIAKKVPKEKIEETAGGDFPF